MGSRAWPGETEIAVRRERLLNALESRQIDAPVLTERLARIDREREELAEKRQALERAQARVRPLPTIELFRSLGLELERRLEAGPTAAAKTLLRPFVRQIVVRRQPGHGEPPSLRAEIVTVRPRFFGNPGDDFARRDTWWRWGESNPRPRTCQ